MIETFLKYLRYELNLSTRTVFIYRNSLKQFEAFMGGSEGREVRWGEVEVNDVRAWMLNRSEAGDVPRTIRNKVQALRAMYKFLMRRGVASDNPAAEVELAKVRKKLPSYMRENNMNNILSAAYDDTDFIETRNRLIIMMFYATGMRQAELIGLTDVNVDTRVGELKVRGKRNKERIVPFGEELAEAIEHYRELRMAECGFVTESFFVRGKNAKPLYQSMVYKIVHETLAAEGGSNKFSPHVLRHSFATAMLNDGAEINSVKELLGHESLSTTQVYTHVTFNELREAYRGAHPRTRKEKK